MRWVTNINSSLENRLFHLQSNLELVFKKDIIQLLETELLDVTLSAILFAVILVTLFQSSKLNPVIDWLKKYKF